jgi:hypothetical protein
MKKSDLLIKGDYVCYQVERFINKSIMNGHTLESDQIEIREGDNGARCRQMTLHNLSIEQAVVFQNNAQYKDFMMKLVVDPKDNGKFSIAFELGGTWTGHIFQAVGLKNTDACYEKNCDKFICSQNYVARWSDDPSGPSEKSTESYSAKKLLDSKLVLPQVLAIDNAVSSYADVLKPIINVIVNYAGIFTSSLKKVENIPHVSEENEKQENQCKVM